MPTCMEASDARTRQYKELQNAKALEHREAKELAQPLLTIMEATLQGCKFVRWPLENAQAWPTPPISVES
eukprot:1989860-Pleurochrysis_carterae.AAC.1